MHDGSTPALAAATTRAIGRAFSRLACDSDIITRQAAPSFNGEELPAVTVPSFSNAGLSPASFSKLVSARGPSSFSNADPSVKPTGTSSLRKWQAACAAIAF